MIRAEGNAGRRYIELRAMFVVYPRGMMLLDLDVSAMLTACCSVFLLRMF